jgi:hypothetical protein
MLETDEPRLTYGSLEADVPSVVGNDTVTALCVSSKIIAVGTESGLVYVLDYEGHQIQRFSREKGHTKTVTDLCFDEAAEALASCSADGTAVVHSLYSEETYTFGSPKSSASLTSIAIDPRWSVRKSKEIIFGTSKGTVVLASKGWLGPNETVLFQGKGPVWCVQRKSIFLAWSTPTGVRVYNTSNHTRIGKVVVDSSNANEGEKTPVLLEWGSNEQVTLLVAFGTTVKVCTILPSNSLFKLQVNMTFSLGQSAHILGIANRKGPGLLDCFDHLLLVSDEEGLTTVRGYKDTGEQLFSDEMPPKNVELLLPSEEGSSTTLLGSASLSDPGRSEGPLEEQRHSSHDDRLLYIYGPKGIMVVQTRSSMDRIQWLQERCRFDEALEIAQGLEEPERIVLQVGEAYLEHLFESKDYITAARVCPRVLGNEAAPWERWVFLFGQAGMLHLLAPSLPISSPTLAPSTYDLAASACLTYLAREKKTLMDGSWLSELRDIARRWPPSLYDARGLLSKVKARLAATSISSPVSTRSAALLSVAALLHAALGEHAEALQASVQAGRQSSSAVNLELDPFDYVMTHGLFAIAASMVEELMELDAQRTLKLLIDAAEDVDIGRVVSRLEGKPPWEHHLYRFLHASWRRDPSSVAFYADLYVSLCAEYEPSRLHHLLTVDTSYRLDTALKACRAHGLINESVYVLGRMGSWEEALRVVITNLRDVKSAVDLLQDQNDQSRAELWGLLLGLVSQQADSELTGSLLDYADGVSLNPLQIINSIPDGMAIDRLRDRIVRLVLEIDASREIRRGSAAALRSDCLELLDALLITLKRGLRKP